MLRYWILPLLVHVSHHNRVRTSLLSSARHLPPPPSPNFILLDLTIRIKLCQQYKSWCYSQPPVTSSVFQISSSALRSGILWVYIITSLYQIKCGPDSSVGITTELRAGRSGNRFSVEARFSAPVQTGPGAHPASCTMGTGSFPAGKSGLSVTLTPHPF